MKSSPTDEPRRIAAIPWYRQEQWERWRQISNDRDNMSEFYENWLNGANDAVKDFTKAGIEVHCVTIDVEEFADWVKSEGAEVDGHSRAEFASRQLAKKLLKPDPLPEMIPDSAQLKAIMKELRGRDLSEVWEPYLRRPAASVCPVFRKTRAGLEQFGSGTLIRIADVHFLLTAAHVTDEKLPLLLPAKQGFTELYGSFAGSSLPDSGSRKEDQYDIAYVRMDTELVARLHDDFLFLNERDCDTFDEAVAREAYTIIGWPARRARKSANIRVSSILYVSGDGVADHRFELLNCNRRHHLLVQHRRKRSVQYSTMRRSQLPHPEGMSGGGVFAWSKDLPKLSALAQPKLVGLVTEYHQQQNVFIATRLACYLAAIRLNEPSLPIFLVPRPGEGNGVVSKNFDN
jgi:hypothetical protein